jgi:hypothetical protein
MKIKCLQCGYEQEVKSWRLDKLGYCTTCDKCNSSFDIDKNIAQSILVPIGTKVKLKDGRTGIIDGNDFESTENFENINYYFCEDKFIHLKYWSNYYEMILKENFDIMV